MKLFKYCPEQFHPKNCETIQIGTLDYFRESDNKFIADPNEGKLSQFQIEAKKSDDSYSKNVTELLSKGGIRGTGIKLEKGTKMVINHKIEIPNSYLFCCSFGNEPSEKQMKELGYDSFYEITNPSEFERIITENIKVKILADSKGDFDLKINRKSGKVNYGPREKIKFSSHLDFFQFSLFQKPVFSELHSDVQYSKNEEYRFVWLPRIKNNEISIPVNKEPILINNSELKKHLKW